MNEKYHKQFSIDIQEHFSDSLERRKDITPEIRENLDKIIEDVVDDLPNQEIQEQINDTEIIDPQQKQEIVTSTIETQLGSLDQQVEDYEKKFYASLTQKLYHGNIAMPEREILVSIVSEWERRKIEQSFSKAIADGEYGPINKRLLAQENKSKTV